MGKHFVSSISLGGRKYLTQCQAFLNLVDQGIMGNKNQSKNEEYVIEIAHSGKYLNKLGWDCYLFKYTTIIPLSFR